MEKPVVYHIPVCPFSQRLEILLELKGLQDAVDFEVVDITRPRPAWLLELTGGRTALPVMCLPDGQVVSESLVIMETLEDMFPEPLIARRERSEREIELGLVALERQFAAAGYRLVMNQASDARPQLMQALFDCYGLINAYLERYSPRGTFLFDDFGYAEAVFTPLFQRFWFLDYYEGFSLPEESRFARVLAWRAACLSHPATQQVTYEEIVKLYYDYALGAGNGALVDGRSRSSFVFAPHWVFRPWPPRDKYSVRASDADLGLVRPDRLDFPALRQ